MIRLDVTDTATPALKKLLTRLKDPRRINKIVAAGALPVVQNRLRENARTNKNKFGARSTFWNRMLSGTTAKGEDDAAVIRMPGEMGLRIHGGTVRPKKSKYLAIPAVKEAYGKSPRDFDDLRFAPLFGRGGGGALIQREQQRISYRRDGTIGRGRKQGGRVFYWLKPSATIQGDKDLVPSEDELIAAGTQALKTFFDLSPRGARA